MRYSLVPLEWKHYMVCKQLFQQTFDMSEYAPFVKAWQNRSESNSFVIFYKGALLAFGLVDLSNKIQYICVDERFRNASLGSILLKKILDSLSDERSIWLTSASDERLLTWYGRHGFQVIQIFRDRTGKFDGADMVRRQHCRSSDLKAQSLKGQKEAPPS